MDSQSDASWRATYLLGVSMLLPFGTVVLVVYYFTRMDPFASGTGHWAFSVIALAGGLSALMASLLTIFATFTYRARVRFENEYRNLQRYLNEDVARERTRMARNLDIFSASQQVSMAIKQEVDFERVLAVVLEQLEHFARSDSVTVFTLDDQCVALPRAERRRGKDRFPPDLTPDSVDRTLVDEAARAGQALRLLNPVTGEFILAVYFATPDGVRGVVRISRNVADEPDFEDEIPAFEQAIGQLVRMVSLGLKTANMWDRAIKDEKTGLYNANHYADQIRRQVAAARRTGMPLSLIMLDIDKFKYVNDTYGHLAGDIVLAQVAQILMREARDSDTPFRYGGEELCILCTGTTESDAAQAAERLRQLIACTEFYDDRGRLLPISASFGVAEFDPAAMAGETELKEACDQALYQAKNHGRNAVVICRGREDFGLMERTGDLSREVKRRLGLAGDNSPLHADDEPVASAGAASARASLGESMDALATDLAEAVANDVDRARVVDSIVREATEILTRNLSARLGEPAVVPAPKRKRAPRRKAGDKTQAEAVATAEKPKAQRRRSPRRRKSEVAPGQPERRRTPRRKSAQTEAERLAAESDRLDYLTDSEAELLASGLAPSKRLRAAEPVEAPPKT